MKPTLCSRCKKNLAVVFITKIDGGKTVNEGLCLKCAKEMGIKPVDDMIERMGLSEDDLENLNGEMTEAMNGLESLLSQGHDAEDGSEDDEADSQTATFPFLNKLFGAAGQGQDNTPAVPEPEKTENRQRSGLLEQLWTLSFPGKADSSYDCQCAKRQTSPGLRQRRKCP